MLQIFYSITVDISLVVVVVLQFFPFIVAAINEQQRASNGSVGRADIMSVSLLKANKEVKYIAADLNADIKAIA